MYYQLIMQYVIQFSLSSDEAAWTTWSNYKINLNAYPSSTDPF
jgi:hypothetical protein